MHVLIDDDGDAHVTNYRHSNFLEGTENFIVFRNLDNSTIENFKVTVDGRQYEYVDNWDLHASLEEKAFKSGVIQTFYLINSTRVNFITILNFDILSFHQL